MTKTPGKYLYLPLIAAAGPDDDDDGDDGDSASSLPSGPHTTTATTTDNNNSNNATEGKDHVDGGEMAVQTDPMPPPPPPPPRRRQRQCFAEDVVPMPELAASSSSSSSSSSVPAPMRLRNAPNPSFSTATGASPGGFCCHHLRNADSCRVFFQSLSGAKCVSFEFLYRRVPVAAVAAAHGNSSSSYPGHAQDPGLETGLTQALANDLKALAQQDLAKDVARRWGSLLAWSCPKSSDASHGGVNHATNLVTVAAANKEKKRTATADHQSCERTQGIDPHVLAGVAMGFGGDCGFYLPLPCLLPLLLPTSDDPHEQQQQQHHHRGHSQHARPGLPHQGGPGPNRVMLERMDKLRQLTETLSGVAASDQGLGQGHAKSQGLGQGYVKSQGLGQGYAKSQGLVCGFTDQDPAVLICRFVGFPLLFNSCPSLRKARTGQGLDNDGQGLGKGGRGSSSGSSSRGKYNQWVEQQKQLQQQKEQQLQQQQQHGGTNSNSSNSNVTNIPNSRSSDSNSRSNPLLSVSRYWAAACRAAMALEWRRGACVEWQILSEIMASPTVTKVTTHPLSTHPLITHGLSSRPLVTSPSFTHPLIAPPLSTHTL